MTMVKKMAIRSKAMEEMAWTALPPLVCGGGTVPPPVCVCVCVCGGGGGGRGRVQR